MVEMFKCPLCGHRRTVQGWNPISLNDTITVQEVRGAGRGHGFVTAWEDDATLTPTGLDLLAMARRCLQIVGLCLRSWDVFASDLVDDVPWQLQEEVVSRQSEG